MIKCDLQDSIKILNEYGFKHVPYVEHIWGHRFRSEQTPMLILLELMCVIENQYQAKNKGYIKNILCPKNTLLYFNHRRNFKLRRLLYQNEILESIYRLPISDDEKWSRQLEYLTGDESEFFSFSEDDIKHLKSGFKSFENYYNAISILSSLTYDQLSKKRWTSKFVFPINEEFVWCDFDHIKESEDRRFFSRGGELVYLMLCRAHIDTRMKLEQLFEDWLVPASGDAFTELARTLTRTEERIPLEENRRKKLGFLPYLKMSNFDALASDFNQVLAHKKIQNLDKIKILSDLIGYHVGNYIHTTGSISNQNKTVGYIVEVLSKTSNSIRKASIQSISVQRNILKQALKKEINFISAFYKDDSRQEDSEKEADQYFVRHINNYPQICFKYIGFVSKKNTRNYRYVITESFLHSLVITMLGDKKRMEFTKFVSQLRDRYHIYIDQQPALNTDILQGDLNKNLKNLSHLLYQMGMLRHLSDACSYVINPYSEDAV